MVNTKTPPLRETLLLGAFYGFIVWMSYAVLEFLLATTASVYRYQQILTPLYWQLTLRVWGVYALAGIVLGAVGAYLTARLVPSARQHRFRIVQITAICTLLLAFLMNLCTAAGPDIAAVVCVAAMLAGMVASLFSSRWETRTGILQNRWVTAGLVLTISYVGTSYRHSRLLRPALALTVIAIVLGGSSVSRRFGFRKHAGRPVLFKTVTTLAGIVLVVGSAAWANRPIALLNAASTSAPSGKHVPIVLVSMDTVRADHLSVYGYRRNTTPNLARFASEATLYRHAVSAADMTLPAHAAMFTGMYASWNGAHYDARKQPQPLSRRYPTVAEILAKNGYLTVSVAANVAYFQPEFGFNRGFAVFDAPTPLPFLSFEHQFYLRFGIRKLLNLFGGTTDFDRFTRRASDVNDAIGHILRRDLDAAKPLFLFANYMDAHCPYTPPRPFDRMFDHSTLHLTAEEYYQLANDVGALKRVVTLPEREHLTSQYDGSIAYLDSQLGELITRLKQMEIYDEALIIITADHGEAFGDRNLVGHGLSVYQNQINVPLMIKYPRQRTARVIDRPASHIDLLPTILDVLGYPAPAHLQGQSLLRDTGPPRELFSESFAQLKLIETHPRFNRVERAMVVNNLKLVWSSVGKHELYDLSNDPDEERDLCGLDQAACAGLQARLDEWRALIPRSQSPAVKLDRDGLGRLRNLGYIK